MNIRMLTELIDAGHQRTLIVTELVPKLDPSIVPSLGLVTDDLLLWMETLPLAAKISKKIMIEVSTGIH